MTRNPYASLRRPSCLVAALLAVGLTACAGPSPHRPAPAAGPAIGSASTSAAAFHHRSPSHQTTVQSAAAVTLPDRARTPGAVNPEVTQSDIGTTICRSGWTSTVRPDSGYTSALKIHQLASGYAVHGNTDPGAYEEDHLIPLELGGSPASPRNLWPEPLRGTEGAVTKDRLENTLRELVCDRVVPLAVARRAIAANWWRAYRHYLGAGVPSGPRPHPRHTAQPRVGHGCTRTSTGSCIRGGEFCSRAAYGTSGRAADGTALVCSGDRAHPRWEH